MRILLTGATGLIGKEVGKLLVEKGHELIVVSRNPEKALMELPFPARAHAWRGGEAPFPADAIAGVDAVIHLAGEPIADGRWSDERKKEIRDSRVAGTRSLVTALNNEGKSVRAFIQGSAIGFYGERGDTPITEAAPVGEDFLSRLVADWEAEARALKAGRVVLVRTGIVLSRRGGALLKMLPLFSRGLGGKLGSGQQWMSWIHIEDIAQAFVFALENESVQGAINATAPEAARNDRFTIQLARALGRSVFLPVPEAALKAAMGESAQIALTSQRVVPERLLELGFQFAFPDLLPALEEVCAPLRGGQHEMFAEQWVPGSPAEIFPFFCDETNLEKITPPFLGFRVLGKSTPEIQEGTLIDYRLSLHGIPLKWRTQIASWIPGKSFVDMQLKGPYQKWEHTHEFLPMAGGTLMRDRVLYRLPLGLIGEAFAGWKVTRDVRQIFAFRRQFIAQRFGLGIQSRSSIR